MRRRHLPVVLSTITGLAAATAAVVLGLLPVDSAAAAPEGPPTGAAGVHAANVGTSVPVAAAPTKTGQGFWVASTDGAVSTEGDARSYGDASAVNLNAPVVGIAATPSGQGYWLLGGDGGVFNYGDARFLGSTGGVHLNQPALQMVATPSGNGYWFVARDGGVFNFGDAGFYGSTGSIHLNKPIVGMAATATGQGYWLVARDGGIFQFGDAGFYGSTGNVRLNQPIVAMAPTRTGQGYWLVARDGGVFDFGDATFHGSAATGQLPAPAISIVATGDGGGYWILLANGEILPFGDAGSVPTAPVASVGYSLVGQVITIDPGHNGGNANDPAFINSIVPSGPGQSKPCDTVGTSGADGYPEHAYNFGQALALEAVLRSRGATVVLTRTNDTGVGPCVDQRAAIGNAAGSDAAISIHADGAPASGRGYSVLEPALIPGYNDEVAATSATLGSDIQAAMSSGTPMPVSDYYGSGGIAVRGDLGGLNLSTVPKVLVEVGNMKNPADLALEESPVFLQQAAGALADGLSAFLLS